MRAWLTNACVLALLVGGFAFTGDAGRIVARGRGVLEATTVPHDPNLADTADAGRDSPPASEADPPEAAPPRAVAADPGEPRPAPPTTAEESRPQSPAPDAPVAARVAPPTAGRGPAEVRLAALASGDRVVVWIGGGRRRATPIAFDLVDPSAGDALEQRDAGADSDGPVHAPLRRVRILGTTAGSSPAPATGVIVRGQTLFVAPHRPARDAAASERTGTVTAIEVVTRPAASR